MSRPERRTEFHIVTSADARVAAFQSTLGRDRVVKVAPRFTEDGMIKPINHQPAEWPMETSQRKAFQDIAAHMVRSYVSGMVETGHQGDVPVDGKRVIRIYSDTINIAYAGDTADDTTVVLEKPKNLSTWLTDRTHGAMTLSGKNTEVCTALTAIDMTNPDAHPATILVRTTYKAKPFTQEDVKTFVKTHGEQSILKSASGISFINKTVELYDTSSPLRVYIQTDPNLPPNLLYELPTWDHLTQEDRLRLLYGAIPEAMQILLSQFQPAKPQTGDGRKV